MSWVVMDNEEVMAECWLLFKLICLWQQGGVYTVIEKDRGLKKIVCVWGGW